MIGLLEVAYHFGHYKCGLKCVENRRAISLRNNTPVHFSNPVCQPLSSISS